MKDEDSKKQVISITRVKPSPILLIRKPEMLIPIIEAIVFPVELFELNFLILSLFTINGIMDLLAGATSISALEINMVDMQRIYTFNKEKRYRIKITRTIRLLVRSPMNISFFLSKRSDMMPEKSPRIIDGNPLKAETSPVRIRESVILYVSHI